MSNAATALPPASIPAAPESLCSMVRKAVFRSFDVQEDDLARENRLSRRCYGCDLEKGLGHYAGCVARNDPNANLSDDELAAIQAVQS